MAQPRKRIEPTWGQAPIVGQPDPHTEHVGEVIANVGIISAAVLKQVFEESEDPNASPEDQARAKARLRAGLTWNETIATAGGDFAQGRTAQSQMMGQSREGFTNSNRADEFAAAAARHFESSRDNLTKASHGLGLEPALAKVLEKAGQTVSGFFQGIGRAAVSLQALASRALAIPGMVRNKIANGIDRVDVALQGAFDDFHTATAQRVDRLRDKAAEIAGAAYDGVAAVHNSAQAKVDAVRDGVVAVHNSAQAKVDAVRDGVAAVHNRAQAKVDAIRDGVNSKVEAGKQGVAIAGAGVLAVGDIVDSRVVSPLREWLANTALPAIKEFATEFEQEFNNRFEERKSQSVSFGDRLAARGAHTAGEPVAPKSHGMS